MPIQVTCPGCMSRFTVSEKFAGKTGPCPKCKKEIKIPEESEQVVIHAPEESGPKDSTGKSVLKPIRRESASLSKVAWVGIIGGVVFVFLAAIVIRLVSSGTPHPALLVLGALAVAPPLIIAGYGFLRDDELAGYTGKDLWIRTAICTVVFALTWGLYYFLSHYFENKTVAETPVLQMGILMALMIGIGTGTSLAAFELEAMQAGLHYMLYFVVTFLLCLIMGIALGEPLAGTKKPKPGTTPPSKPVSLNSTIGPHVR